MRLHTQAGLLLLALLAAGTAQAKMYKWVDEQGNIHYSQERPPQAGVEEIKPPPPPADAPPARRQDAAEQTGSGGPGPTGDAEGDDLQAKVYKKNCEIARKNLDIYTQHSRVLNAQGEVEELDEETRQARIREARENIKKYCK